MDRREYLASLVYTPQEVDDWLAGRSYSVSRYDSELGYVHSGGWRKDGMDGSICTYSYDENSARSQIAFAGEPCGINTYGDSFTHCDQVNGGETWQERLAAHLGEPIRNFGVGGYSVYQAYLRMRREEARVPAEYIIFNIWDYDHFRSLNGWQTINFGKKQRRVLPTLPYVEVNLDSISSD